MFLIHDDEAEGAHGGKDGAPGSDDDEGFATEDAAPLE